MLEQWAVSQKGTPKTYARWLSGINFTLIGNLLSIHDTSKCEECISLWF